MPPPPIPPSHPPADPRESTTTATQPPTLRKKPSAGILTTTTSASGHRTTRITTTAAACPAAPTTTSASSPAVPLSRHPFKRRDQNATSTARGMRAGFDPKAPTPTTARQTTPRMPSYERPGPTSTRQPQVPTAAKAVNNSGKPPVTPKVATRLAPSTTSTQHQNPTSVATPLPRRPRPDTILSANGSGPRDKLDITSPVAAFLNTTNVTPRSGSRQNRVESAHSTPNATPNIERHESFDSRNGLSISPSVVDDVTSRRPVVTFSPASDVSGAGHRQDPDSKFFYAADVPRQTQQAHPRPVVAPQQARNTTFFHASGSPAPDRSSVVSPLVSPAATSNDSLMSKFFYANGAPELQPAPKFGPTRRGPSSVVSTASRIPTNRTGNALRPTSPVGVQPKVKSGHNTPLVSPRSPIASSHHRLSVGSQGWSGLEQTPHSTGAERAHARPKSLTIADAPAIARLMSSHGSIPPTPASEATSPLFAPPSTILPGSPGMSGFASLLQAAEDFAESEEGKSESLNSPAKSSSQEKEPLSDLVANARRERKVQDLQITNASLEAINRTLERQLRKQTAELRRYKRMSRMSMASLSNRVPSASTAAGGGLAKAGMELNDLNEEEGEIAAGDAAIEELEEEDEEEEEEEEEDFMSGSEHSDSGSSGANTERNESRQKRDERRLQIDLSKHQQLLVDSQKMNQSLKRCLGWTEELIKEGKRALAYNITVSDVELGGRVLVPEEIEALEPQQEEDGSVMENDIEDYEDELKDDSLYGEEPRLDNLGGTDTENDDLKDDSLYGDDPRLDDDLRDDSLYGDNPRLDDDLRDDSLYGDILRSDDDLRDDSLYGDNPRYDDDLNEDSLYGENPQLDDDLDSSDTEDEKERRKTWRPDAQDRDSGVELPTDSR
ncbi:uncharacterized protein QC763_0085440 [Podospora pseudopauciseta]|uniref:Uncharacterized protein n=1 Tax=Podospora pseudopauciseta TaxID=2093780 RepID=A0ABR0H8L5_9PEZI|nr:hypothetical protein QC763_0085440 [Podospora pseudopauciseta]